MSQWVRDPIFVKIISDKLDDQNFYSLAKDINQIKEDYATARLLLTYSQYKKKQIDNLSRRTLYVNTSDYSGFNLYHGLMKSSFKEAYNIFDKIVGLINKYLSLGLNEKKIYYHTIWLDEKKKIRKKILDTQNVSLYALYDIFQDFNTEDFRKIREIRNIITHRKLVIFDSVLSDPEKIKDIENIDYDRMLNETIHLFQLAKATIIYLINFVNTEENKKHKDSKGLILPIEADTTQYWQS